MYLIKRNIPNIITLSNLFCGLIAILYAFGGHLNMAGIFILSGMFLDFLDGMTARIMNITSNLGKQLDSLADLITFGVAPGILMFQLIYYSQANSFFNPFENSRDIYIETYWSYIALLIPMFSSIRLARFNINDQQEDKFIGIPTPANALFFISIPMMIEFQQGHIITQWITQPHILISLCVLMSLLLISKISLLTLKFKNLKWGKNQFRYILLFSSSLFLLLLQFISIPFIIILYVILSLINNFLKT